MSVLSGPSGGDWSVFAEQVVAERDALREENANLKTQMCRERGLNSIDVAIKEAEIAALSLEIERLKDMYREDI